MTTLALDTDPTKDLVEDIRSRSLEASRAISVTVECGKESVWRLALCDISKSSQRFLRWGAKVLATFRGDSCIRLLSCMSSSNRS
jgi:hypothetical protein